MLVGKKGVSIMTIFSGIALICSLFFILTLFLQSISKAIYFNLTNGFKVHIAGYWHSEVFSFVFPSHPQDVQSCGRL